MKEMSWESDICNIESDHLALMGLDHSLYIFVWKPIGIFLKQPSLQEYNHFLGIDNV